MAKAKPEIDPFTLEIIKEGLMAISDEMFIATQRTSMSTIIYEVLDFAVGITNEHGHLITQGNGATLFLGTLDFGDRTVLDKYGLENIKPGDIFLTNDPYIGGGTHLSDVTSIGPIFYEGELVAFSANKGHWTEVGGMAPGSWTTNSTEVFQEGLQIPCVKVFGEGRANEGVIDMIRANSRMPDMTIGDMYGQVASVRVAERRFTELSDKYGIDVVKIAIDAMLDYGEERTRQELRKIPDGVYEAVDYIDDDGLGNGPFEIRAKVTVKDGNLICDFTGSQGVVPGPINTGRTGLYSAVRAVLMGLTDPSIRANEGCFRAAEIICPDDTVFTARHPAPVSTYWETGLYAGDLVWKAMAPVLPDRLTAGHFLSVCGLVLSGIHPDTGELFLLVEPSAGGWGAGYNKDGESGLVCIGDGETFVIPVEVAETRYGLLVDQYALDITDGGAGEFRGGRGLVRDYRITAKEALYTGTFGRHKYLPWGMENGADGSKNYTAILKKEDGEPDVFGKTAQYYLRTDDVVRLVTGTGGGYGKPLKRPVEKVQDDVKGGYITLEQAERDYGVVLNPDTLEVEKFVGGRKN